MTDLGVISGAPAGTWLGCAMQGGNLCCHFIQHFYNSAKKSRWRPGNEWCLHFPKLPSPGHFTLDFFYGLNFAEGVFSAALLRAGFSALNTAARLEENVLSRK